jgi:hypothetical protein
MDVIINYGINYKKCAQVSYSGYQRKSLLSHLLHHVIHRNKEISYALIAELHCSSYYKDIENFFIHYLSQYVLYYDISLAFFIYQSFEKIKIIKKNLPKSYRNIGLINSNEIRNMYSTIISKLLSSKIISKHDIIKIGNKSHHSEYYLLYSNLSQFYPVIDSHNKELEPLLSRGIREILYYNETRSFQLNKDNYNKIIFWILWLNKIEKKVKDKYIFMPTTKIIRKYDILEKKKFNQYWEYFIWDKILQKCDKNGLINKTIIKSLMKLFYHNYNHSKCTDRSGLLAIGVLISNMNVKIPIKKVITEDEIFSNLNSNIIYKNITTENNNDNEYLNIYNAFYNIKKKDETKTKNIYQQNKMETKMDLLKNYCPKMNNRENKISDYFNE